jgi:hypothetical protein
LEVEHCDNEFAHQLTLWIEVLDPRDALLGASVPEIYYDFVHWVACSWDVVNGDDASYSHLDLFEFVDRNGQTG